MAGFEYDLLVIGSGPAGQRAAIQAAKLGKRTLLVESKGVVGGVCINTGTIPSKTLRQAVMHLSGYRERGIYGASYAVKQHITMKDLHFRTEHVIRHEIDVTRHQLQRNHVEMAAATASFVDDHSVNLAFIDGRGQQTVTADRVVIASGTHATRDRKIPFDGQRILISDDILALESLPRSMAIVGAGVIGIEYATMFAALGVRISGALSTTLVAGTWIAPARAGARRILALLAIPSTASGTEEPAGPPSLRFSHVAFSYGGSASGRAAVLRDVDFLAQAAAVTAIVGPSGAGKTTITRLAARFWDADGGAVEFAGVDVRKTPLDWLMRQISFVFQDVTLLDDTIAANLRLAQPDATDDDLVRAATAAAAHGFISALPEGYKTLVGDRGLRISRGERQRLQLARAFLKDAPVLILDEPTSSLDPATEGEVYEALATFAKGKTVLVVTHRLATIASADSIVVLGADGTVAAQGTHAQLLATSPLYAALWEDYHAAIDVAATAEEAPAR